MRMIYYLGSYSNSKYRNCAPSAKSKMDYIIAALNNLNYSVSIISPSSGIKGDFKLLKKEDYLKSYNKLIIPKSYVCQFKLLNAIKYIYTDLWMLIFILFNIKKDDKVIVYHSLGYYKLITILKKLIGFKMILEVEEIYSDVIGNKKLRAKELAFFKLADSYIFPTELLDQYVNTEHKPSTIVYGTYKVEKERGHKFHEEDGKIHLVYAGTFDPRKGGVSVATATGEYLDKNFHIHILGFGSGEEKKVLKKQIEEVNSKNGAIVTMDGLLSGEDYIKFLQSCDVGFSTQNPDADFNDTSFPSKVLSYLSNGLRVVSVRIKALEESKIGNLLYFYDGKEPKKIAETIKSINFDEPYDSREFVSQLDKEFTESIKKIL